VSYGLNTDVRRNWGGRFAAFLGQSYRLREESAFSEGSGLDEQLSNYVGRMLFSPHRWFSTAYHFQTNRDDLSANRNRASVAVGSSAFNLSASYIYIDRRSQLGLSRNIEQLGLANVARLTEHWRVQLRHLSSLAQDDEGTLHWGGSMIYEDECLIAGIDLTRRYIGSRDNPPDTALVLRVAFKNLGQVQTGLF
jgi:LPS-assembly protein